MLAKKSNFTSPWNSIFTFVARFARDKIQFWKLIEFQFLQKNFADKKIYFSAGLCNFQFSTINKRSSLRSHFFGSMEKILWLLHSNYSALQLYYKTTPALIHHTIHYVLTTPETIKIPIVLEKKKMDFVYAFLFSFFLNGEIKIVFQDRLPFVSCPV